MVHKYVKDKDKPLFNRALQGAYPPGSVFKPIVATAALEEKVVSPSDTITDNGYIEAGPIQFRNWLYTKYGRTDGQVDMLKGLQRSNDIYFYKLGEKVTYQHLRSWAEKFGLGQHSGIALADVTGTVPSDFWKREKIGERWFLGDTYNMSIGQGYLLTTPIQIARATSVFANGGKLCKPQLLKLDAHENRLLLSSNKPDCKNMELEQQTLDVIREGMKRACEAGGTGWPFFEFKINDERMLVGCKTGTAESHGVDKHPHAWFTVFAPFDNPQIVLTVMVENGGEGSEVAAPIAKDVLTQFFTN
jgi:penicillin-binding protein 2